jgi:hypothetical protein
MSGSAGEVGLGLVVVEDPPVDDDVQSAVELAVAEGVEPVAGDLAGGCRQRADPARAAKAASERNRPG